MQTYDRIVLAIPHAQPVFDLSLWSDPDTILKDVWRWTDWHTDNLFAYAEHCDPRIKHVIGRVNRFNCDFERLINDPLEEIGQGILYTSSHSGATRTIPEDKRREWLRAWELYRERIVKNGLGAKNPILLDCHSFPGDIDPEVDICIGWNEDESKPDDEVLSAVRGVLENAGFRVAFNKPYSNSILPEGWQGSSMLIELNKGIYMKEPDMELLPRAGDVDRVLRSMFDVLLGGPAPKKDPGDWSLVLKLFPDAKVQGIHIPDDADILSEPMHRRIAKGSWLNKRGYGYWNYDQIPPELLWRANVLFGPVGFDVPGTENG